MLKCEDAISHFAKSETIFKIIENKMPQIKEAVKILKIPYEVTKSLQKPEFTLSDFYGSCIAMRERLNILNNKRNKRTDLAAYLIDEFDARRPKMLQNQAMLAAVYLDRRFSVDLKEREVELAKHVLCNLWDRVKNTRTNTNSDNPDISDETLSNESSEDESHFDFAAFFKAKGFVTADSINPQQPHTSGNGNETSTVNTDGSQKQPNYKKTKSEFLCLLDEFERKFPLINHETPVLSFWNEHREQFPEIYEVAIILIGIPASQSTIERSFSHFGFVFSCRRCNLASNLLEDILFIRLNKELAYKVFKDDLEKLILDFHSSEKEQEPIADRI